MPFKGCMKVPTGVSDRDSSFARGRHDTVETYNIKAVQEKKQSPTVAAANIAGSGRVSDSSERLRFVKQTLTTKVYNNCK